MPMQSDTYDLSHIESMRFVPAVVLHSQDCECYRCTPFGHQLWEGAALWAKRTILARGVVGVAEALRRL